MTESNRPAGAGVGRGGHLLPDLAGRAEIEVLVDLFYGKVRADELLGPVFDDIAKVDWSTHLPKLYAFWQTVLFGEGNFQGNPMKAHFDLAAEVPLPWPMFERWLELFHATVDEHFYGIHAERIKKASASMAQVIHARVNSVPSFQIDLENLTPEQKARYAKYRQGG